MYSLEGSTNYPTRQSRWKNDVEIDHKNSESSGHSQYEGGYRNFDQRRSVRSYWKEADS